VIKNKIDDGIIPREEGIFQSQEKEDQLVKVIKRHRQL